MNRNLLPLVLVVTLGVLCGSCQRRAPGPNNEGEAVPAYADQFDWPSFRGNPASTGVAESVLGDQLKLLWTYQARSGVESTAAIVNGTVFVGTDEAGLVALDLATGKPRWTFPTDEAISAAPCVHNGRVFVGDLSGTFHAVDARTGKSLWKAATEEKIVSAANIVGDAVVVGSYDNYLYCFKQEDGTPLWKLKTGSYVYGGACVFEDRVAVVGCDGVLRIMDARTGQEQGQVELNTNVGATPAWRDGRIYVATYDDRVLCIDPAGRRIVWQWDAPSGSQFTASPAVTDQYVIVGDARGKVRGLSTSKGEKLWEFETREQVGSSPVVSGDRVYFGSDDGNVYGLAVADGKEVWRFAAGGTVSASPAVARGRMVISNKDGSVYCFGPKSK